MYLSFKLTGALWIKYWIAKNVPLVFFHKMALVVLSFVFNFTWNSSVSLYCDSCHISLHLKRNLPKLVNFCVAILILKMEENMQHFQHIMLYYFQKGENSTETHKKDLCSVWWRCCDWLNTSKVVCEVSCWRFLVRWCSMVG